MSDATKLDIYNVEFVDCPLLGKPVVIEGIPGAFPGSGGCSHCVFCVTTTKGAVYCRFLQAQKIGYTTETTTPKEAERYPITMRVSRSEQKFIHWVLRRLWVWDIIPKKKGRR